MQATWHHYRDSHGMFEGLIDRVKPDGMLVIIKRNGEAAEYAFKEVDYIL
ncbi:MAG: hypothetical protein U5L72_16815 [Bacteroidales bacterium]|nr:hypothetical protein [Bacteroidales bacterium]